MFLVSFAAALILRPPSTAERAPRLATVAWFLLGAAPLTILGFYMKYRFDLHNDIFSGQDPSDIIFNKLLKLSRYKFIFKSFIYEPLTWTKWGLAPIRLAVLVMGFSRGNLQRSAVPVRPRRPRIGGPRLLRHLPDHAPRFTMARYVIDG